MGVTLSVRPNIRVISSHYLRDPPLAAIIVQYVQPNVDHKPHYELIMCASILIIKQINSKYTQQFSSELWGGGRFINDRYIEASRANEIDAKRPSVIAELSICAQAFK